MGRPAHQATFTADDYLAWEPTQIDRHEYLDGEVFVMADAEDRHVTVSMNMAFALRQHLTRGVRFGHYRSLTSLQEYALVDLDTRTTDCYRLGADGFWVLHPFARGEPVSLASVALTLTADQLFADVMEP